MNWREEYLRMHAEPEISAEYIIDGYRYTLLRCKGKTWVMVDLSPMEEASAIQHPIIEVDGVELKVELFELDGFILQDRSVPSFTKARIISPGNNFNSFSGNSMPTSFSWASRTFKIDEIDGSAIKENGFDFMPAWEQLPGVKVLELPDSIEFITTAFNKMPDLESVILSENMWQIEDSFCDCPKLEKVSISANLEMMSTPVFAGCGKEMRMLVPDIRKYAEIDVDWKDGCHYGSATISGLGRTDSTEECFSYGIVDYLPLRSMQVRNSVDSGFEEILLDYDTENLNIWPDLTRRIYLTDRVEPSQPLENYRTGHDCPDYYITHNPACINISNFINVETLEISSGVYWLGREMGEFFKNAEKLEKIILNGPMSMLTEDFGALRNVREIRFEPKERAYNLDGSSGVKVETPFLCFYGSKEEFHKIWQKTDKIVEQGCFAGNKVLEVMHLPEGITKIEDNAFAGCEALKEVVIPRSVKSIGEYAFAGCPLLKSVQILNPDCHISPHAFDQP